MSDAGRPPTPPAAPDEARRGGAWSGFAAGLAPLAVLLATAAAALAATAIARRLAASDGFFAQQDVAVGTIAAGLVAALALYVLAARRVLGQATAWRRQGLRARATGALWGLGVTAVVVALPLVLAALWPQHPAP